MKARIAGVACAIPRKVVKNEGALERVGKAVGVAERRHVEEQSLNELAYFAAYEVLKNTGLAPKDMGAVILVSQTQPRRMPSASCEIAHTLGIQAPAFDLNMACSGYVYGLWVAASLGLPNTLLIVGDTISKFLDPNDQSTYPIFGDAVSATIVQPGFEGSTFEFVGGTDGRGAGSLFCEDFLRMDGKAVFDFAVRTVPPLVSEVTKNGHCDWYLFHQANRMMVEHIAKKSKLDMTKVPMNLGRYGNVSSASIPLLMCDSEATERLRRTKNRVAMFGFGAGYSWGGVLADVGPIPCTVAEV